MTQQRCLISITRLLWTQVCHEEYRLSGADTDRHPCEVHHGIFEHACHLAMLAPSGPVPRCLYTSIGSALGVLLCAVVAGACVALQPTPHQAAFCCYATHNTLPFLPSSISPSHRFHRSSKQHYS